MVVKEATSTEEGLKERVCASCQLKETEVIPIKKQNVKPIAGCFGSGTSLVQIFNVALLGVIALFFKKR